MVLPDDFFFGGGGSPVSVDGAGRRSDWFRWEEVNGIEPSAEGNDFRDRFAEDFQLMAAYGLGHVRLAFDWARIEPWAGRVDHAALEQIEARLAAARDAGVSVWATLHHGSLPGWFSEDTDGFATSRGPSLHWSRHVDAMAERFDDLVAAWIPVEDPIGWALQSHHFGTRPPGTTSTATRQDAIEGAIDATFEAHRLLASGSSPVIGSFGLPLLRDAETAGAHHAYWESVFWRSWSRAITEGVVEWPWSVATERPDLADAFDAIAVRISPPLSVAPTGALWPWPASSQVRVDASGFRPNAKGLGEVLHRVGEIIPHDVLITGLGVEHADDDWRSSLFEEWLDEIFSAISDGVKIRGVFVEPLIDGYSEAAGAHLDNGVFSRDREPKESFRWIQAQQ